MDIETIIGDESPVPHLRSYSAQPGYQVPFGGFEEQGMRGFQLNLVARHKPENMVGMSLHCGVAMTEYEPKVADTVCALRRLDLPSRMKIPLCIRRLLQHPFRHLLCASKKVEGGNGRRKCAASTPRSLWSLRKLRVQVHRPSPGHTLEASTNAIPCERSFLPRSGPSPQSMEVPALDDYKIIIHRGAGSHDIGKYQCSVPFNRASSP